MKIAVINGSPRRKGTTSTLLDVLVEMLSEQGHLVERFDLSSLKIEPCNECLSCYTREGCTIFDSMLTIYDRLKQADLIVLATPIFFSGPSAQMKALIDRLQAFWALKNVLKRKLRSERPKVLGIVVGARNSKIDERNTISIFKAATDAFDGDYAGTYSLLTVENPENLPLKPVLKKDLQDFLKKAGVL